MNIASTLAAMSLEQKATLVSGQGFWHTKAFPELDIPSVMLTDGPHGLRKQPGDGAQVDFSGPVRTTAFPTASLAACSFDPALIEEMGKALGRECRAEQVGMLLGPGANIKRSPLCGRNFEYFSEDPLLSSCLATAWIKGVQSTGVGASLKHFAVNNQETRRMTVDAVVDPRALREIYLASFEAVVREGRPASVMCAYNRLNGSYCSENPFLLNQVLREEWGFDGLVVSDWGAVNDRVTGLQAGLDLEMPQNLAGSTEAIIQAVQSGQLAESVLDRSVLRILAFIGRAQANGLAGADAPSATTVAAVPADSASIPSGIDADAHHQLARRIARESMVLLKNEGACLPFDPSRELVVLGELARSPRYQGAGSSLLSPTRVESLLDALAARVIPHRFSPGYRIDHDSPSPVLLDDARAMAVGAGQILVVLGLTDAYESEGFDRTHLRLPTAQTELLEALAGLGKPLAVLLVGGAPVELPWLDRVQALLLGYLGGQASGAAQVDLLFGQCSPSGKLAETWPLSLEDCPAHGNFPGDGRQVLYKEGIFVGYRHFLSAGRPVRFPFGFGLGYTSFAYADLRVPTAPLDAGGLIQGMTVPVSFTLTNSGDRAGSEVVQAYTSLPGSAIERPAVELRAFTKVHLFPGETRTITLELTARAFSHWETAADGFRIEGGDWEIRVGGNPLELPLQGTVRINGGIIPAVAPRHDLSRPAAAMSDQEFEAFHGQALPPKPMLRPFDGNSVLADMSRDSVLLRLFLAVAVRIHTRSSGVRKGSPNYRMMADMMASTPVSRFGALSGGSFGPALSRGLVDIANRHPWRGLWQIIRGNARQAPKKV